VVEGGVGREGVQVARARVHVPSVASAHVQDYYFGEDMILVCPRSDSCR
jgi:hypothetical protein